MTTLNVRDENTGNIVAVDTDNPTGSLYVRDANTGNLVLMDLSSPSGKLNVVDANTGDIVEIDYDNPVAVFHVSDPNTGEIVEIDLNNLTGSLYCQDANTGEFILVDLSTASFISIGGFALPLVAGDSTAPTVVITLNRYTFAIGEIATVTFTFSEEVLNFTVADITSPNGSLSSFTITGNPLIYTATFTPTNDVIDSTNVITVGTDWTDLNGNSPSSSTTSSNYTVDTVRPTVSIGLSDSALKIGDTSTITFTFSKAPTGFTSADVTAPNGSLSSFGVTGNPLVYTAVFTPNNSVSDDTNVITVGTGWTDSVGNSPASSTNSSNYTVDTTAPTCTITCAQTSPSSALTFNFTFTFSEVVTGFEVGDITAAITGGTVAKTNFAGSGTTYTCDLTPSKAGTMTVDVAQGVCVDAALNNNAAATQFSMVSTLLVYDTFTGVDNTALVDHAPEKGGTWVIANGAPILATNKLKSPSGAGVRVHHDVGYADVIIEEDMVFYNNYQGVLFRYQDENNYWRAWINSPDGTIKISEQLLGVNYNRASVAGSVAEGDNVHLKVTLSGSNITFEMTGGRTANTSYSSSSGASATKHGIFMISASPNYLCRIDNHTVVVNGNP